MLAGKKIYHPGPSNGKLWSLQDFHIDRFLDRGKYGRIVLAREKYSDFDVSIKIIDDETRRKHKIGMNLFLESKVLKAVKHPNIILRLTTFQDDNHFYFVNEYARYGSVFNVLYRQKNKRLIERLAGKLTAQTASALSAIHDFGFLHGNLKTKHILLDQVMNAKLSGLFLTWPSNNTETRGFLIGCTAYAAPELLKKQKYDESIDLWSLGVVCYELLCGCTPFQSDNIRKMKENIINGQYTFPSFIKEDAKDLISSLLRIKPSERLDLEAVQSHPWITRTYTPPSSDDES